MRAAFAAALVFLAACGASSSTAKKDVTITSCDAGTSGGRPIASGRITNHSSKASAYTIHVKFKDDAGNSVADGAAIVAKVQPNATANWHAAGTTHAKGPLTCSLETVTRTVSP